MADRKKEWIERLAKVKSAVKEEPHLLVNTSRDKIEIAFHSELEPLLKIGDWAVVAVSPQRFAHWSAMFKEIIEQAQKKQQP